MIIEPPFNIFDLWSQIYVTEQEDSTILVTEQTCAL